MRKRKIQEQKRRRKRFFFSLALTLVLALFLLIFLPHMSSQKKELREQGIAAYNQGNYDEAAEKFQASLAEKQWFTRKMDRDTQLYLGNAYLELHQYQNAEAVYNELKEKNKGQYEEEYLDSLIQLTQAFLAMEQEDYETAASGFQAAVDAGNAQLNQYLGACYNKLGDESAMLSCYQNYLMDYPLNLEMAGQLSDYYLETGDYETAKSYIEQGLALQTSDSDSEGQKRLYYNQIVYYEKLLDYETALAEAEHFLELFPDDEDGQREYEFLYTRVNINPEPVNTSGSTSTGTVVVATQSDSQ
jgi:tetratricopeptide (TPR) repeat protein